MKRFLTFIVLCLVTCLAHAALIVEDFTSNSYTFEGPVLDSSSTGITFANNLYTFQDGFSLFEGGAYNYYGERDMFFTFGTSVSLISIDLRTVSFGNSYVLDMLVTLIDTNDSVLKSVEFTLTDSLKTIAMETDNVSKVLIDFKGVGTDFYNAGREHSWWHIDNIQFDTDNNLYGDSISVSTPASLGIMFISLIALGVSRKYLT